jgi:hypothetical protein
MADTDERILDINNSNRPTSLDLSREDNFSDFGTPLNTFDETPKTPNILQNGENGEIAAATATEPRTSRILFTEEAKDGNGTSPKLTRTISEVNKTPDHVPLQPDLGTSPCARNLARTIALHEPGFEKGYDSDGDIGPF